MSAERATEEPHRRPWAKPELKQLAAGLGAVAGPRFPPGDGNSGSGKTFVPPGS